jgi:hypothetical protein
LSRAPTVDVPHPGEGLAAPAALVPGAPGSDVPVAPVAGGADPTGLVVTGPASLVSVPEEQAPSRRPPIEIRTRHRRDKRIHIPLQPDRVFHPTNRSPDTTDEPVVPVVEPTRFGAAKVRGRRDEGRIVVGQDRAVVVAARTMSRCPRRR